MCRWVSQILRRDRRKSRDKTGKNLFFQGNLGKLFQFCSGRIEAPFLQVLDPNSSSFYVKCPRKCKKKPYNFDIFPTLLANLHFFLSRILGRISNLIISPTCILLRLDYAKFGVSDLFFKIYRKKSLGSGLDTPLGKGRVNPIQAAEFCY